MLLGAGDKLGPYEILALIGKGGMGEVYSAHDPRTGRDVAVKVSAERFDREVRAVASPYTSFYVAFSRRRPVSAHTARHAAGNATGARTPRYVADADSEPRGRIPNVRITR
jgi:hypothetical protein